jgi:dipeptidyl aminopeptidase B
MGMERDGTEEEIEPLNKQDSSTTPSARNSHDSLTSVSTTSLILEHLNGTAEPKPRVVAGKPTEDFEYRDDDDIEAPRYMPSAGLPMSRGTKRVIWVIAVIAVVGWSLALLSFLVNGTYKHSSKLPYNHEAPKKGSGKKVTLNQVLSGEWSAHHQEISWIRGADGEDGLLLEKNQPGKDYLVIEDVRSRRGDPNAMASKTLMRMGGFDVNGKRIYPDRVWPSSNLKSILVISEYKKNWRHSFTGIYWLFDVETQKGEPLDPLHPDGRIQLASWSPTSDAVVFTRDNNMFIRSLKSGEVKQITTDGGEQLFYGAPDWVYEEEVYHDNSVTWWAKDGKYIAYLRTNESAVPEYPVQYFLSRPSGEKPEPGLENYPEVRQIKYPKAGAPNPTVDLQFYDVDRAQVFSVDISGGFADDNRLIIEIVWSDSNQVLVRETNRESDTIRIVLIDVKRRTGKVVRTHDVFALDGGWVEPSQTTTFVPADPANGRPHDGYIDTVVYENNDHLGYFSPLDASEPLMLTKGDWEVVDAPSAIDLKNNLVYFVATKQSPTQRHIYSIDLNGHNLTPLVRTDRPAYYSSSFSTGAGYALITYHGPSIPRQELISTPSNPQTYSETVEQNQELARMASSHEIPHEIYSTVTIDNYTLQVVERRPPHFDERKQYPVLFHLYGGPGSQTVDRRFTIDFHSYIASSLNYIVVTVDGRGTGFSGRNLRCSIRDHIGRLEARDQIETAKVWAKKRYVDERRMAIWGWSYGGFLTLKTLELDAGRTFRYGMAVAPVTDWRFYDSVYTERYMHTPLHNNAGYEESAIGNMTALSENVRFLVMHGIADDNVHMQSTLTLIDKLDLAGVGNYDVHVFPDSDHGIRFHNAGRMVYEREYCLPAFAFPFHCWDFRSASADGMRFVGVMLNLYCYRIEQLAHQRLQRRVAKDRRPCAQKGWGEWEDEV